MLQLQVFYFPVFSCQITDRLLASMKVDSDIYCHGRLLLLTQTIATVSVTTNGGRRLLHTITRFCNRAVRFRDRAPTDESVAYSHSSALPIFEARRGYC